MEETNSNKGIEEKRSNKSKVFAIILISSLILNIILIYNLNNFGIRLTGNAVLVNPNLKKDLANNVDPSTYILHYQELKDNLEKEIQITGVQHNVAFFIQDLKTGAWTGKNEKEGFTPASLLKVPIMMAILKKVDRGEISLDDKLIIKKEDIDETYPTIYEDKEGVEVTIRDLLESMVTDSDNTAKNVLIKILFAYEVDDVFKHLGVPNPYVLGNNENKISPRGYSRIFKSLYYSTYLSPELSEFALNLTTNTQIENLLTEGVPENVEVAHKFGIYNEEVLHDCGIIYHKKNPYVICIMTAGLNSIKSSEVIRKISKETYDFVDSR